ncbi:nucleoside 2-deoxyribosyltransferase domain-containing protein [Streptomyces sp. NPDC087294]|uniref:nucleoside 2-deoxyribosyltransferase domain-containing protein n=1 Tax=Streptomyces sp. NPDC087294 TaxID=3365777 RepID=UPI0037F62BCC
MTDLQQLADALAIDYMHGRWKPDPAEEHRARELSAAASADGGLDALGTGGVITASEIARMLRPGPDDAMVASWRLTPVLRAYLLGDAEAQALVRELVHAIGAWHPALTPYDERYVEAPAPYAGAGPAVFIAGGITGTRPWQLQAALQLLSTTSFYILNPRRSSFPVDDPAAHAAQVAWENGALRAAKVRLFWFPGGGAVQPIALYELGAQAARGAPIAVGADPAYVRRRDVVEQLRHARPDVTVHAALADTVQAAAELMAAGAANGAVQ